MAFLFVSLNYTNGEYCHKKFFQRFSSFDIIDFPILKEVRIVRVAARAFFNVLLKTISLIILDVFIHIALRKNIFS